MLIYVVMFRGLKTNKQAFRSSFDFLTIVSGFIGAHSAPTVGFFVSGYIYRDIFYRFPCVKIRDHSLKCEDVRKNNLNIFPASQDAMNQSPLVTFSGDA